MSASNDGRVDGEIDRSPKSNDQREVRTSKQSGDSTEHYYAEMESARNTAMDAYFIARPQILRTHALESIFRAGFERAFAMMWAAANAVSEVTAVETAGRIGPIEPDNDLVICPTCTSQFRAIPVNVQQELRAVLRESDVLQFIGWLSGDIPELHSVEVPRLAQSWNDFRGTQQVISSGPIPPVEPSPLREPTAFQDFVASLPEKATALPIEAQCSWGCHYVGDQFIRYAACTVHGASGNGSEEQT